MVFCSFVSIDQLSLWSFFSRFQLSVIVYGDDFQRTLSKTTDVLYSGGRPIPICMHSCFNFHSFSLSILILISCFSFAISTYTSFLGGLEFFSTHLEKKDIQISRRLPKVWTISYSDSNKVNLPASWRMDFYLEKLWWESSALQFAKTRILYQLVNLNLLNLGLFSLVGITSHS